MDILWAILLGLREVIGAAGSSNVIKHIKRVGSF